VPDSAGAKFRGRIEDGHTAPPETAGRIPAIDIRTERRRSAPTGGPPTPSSAPAVATAVRVPWDFL